jgi:transcriptional regulator with XRE-family HTH domain
MIGSLKAQPPRHESAVRCGVRIRSLRRQRRMTLEAVGKKAGFTKQQIGRVEAGIVNAPLDTLVRIAEALGVNVREFFQDDDGASLFEVGLSLEGMLLRDILAAMFHSPYVPMLGVI